MHTLLNERENLIWIGIHLGTYCTQSLTVYYYGVEIMWEIVGADEAQWNYSR